MNPTIEQALQQGVAAHREGKLKEAEGFYRTILRSQPKHPDANHNLGVLAVSVNQVEVALPLFKTALEASPKVEQFWLSYIDALIKEQQFDNAERVIEQGKQQGVAGEKLNALKAKLSPSDQEENFNNAVPAQQQLDSLLDLYQSGRHDDAETLALSMTTEFPEHSFGWSILGALFGQRGRTEEALSANQRAVELAPNDPGIHTNFGALLHGLGRFEEAEASLRRAIELDPSSAAAHNNLGSSLKELGRLNEAQAIFEQAIALAPNMAEAHNNLGINYGELGNTLEAETRFRQALAIKPDYGEAYYNLGNTLVKLDRLDEAEAKFKQAISFQPRSAPTYNNLGLMLQKMGRLTEAEVTLRKAILINPAYAQGQNNLGMVLQEMGRLEDAEESYLRAIDLKQEYSEALNNLGLALQELGRIDEAQLRYRQAIASRPDFSKARYNLGMLLFDLGICDKASKLFENNSEKNAQSYLLKCLYNLDDSTRFYEQLDLMTTEGKISPTIGSLTMRAENKYGVKRGNVFATDPFKYVLKTDLVERYDFEDVFVRTVKNVIDEKVFSEKSQGLLTNGIQTAGNLFAKGTDPVKEIESILYAEIAEYRKRFKNSEEGFLINWPTKYELYGWLIHMKSGGELAAHMHELGWLSGAVYINVPNKKQANSGDFVVCVDGEASGKSGRTDREEIVEVNTGNLVLFPSSLMHYTIPFESDEERIVLAFDFRPEQRSS